MEKFFDRLWRWTRTGTRVQRRVRGAAAGIGLMLLVIMTPIMLGALTIILIMAIEAAGRLFGSIDRIVSAAIAATVIVIIIAGLIGAATED